MIRSSTNQISSVLFRIWVIGTAETSGVSLFHPTKTRLEGGKYVVDKLFAYYNNFDYVYRQWGVDQLYIVLLSTIQNRP